VHDHSGVGVGADIDGVIIVLGDNDPLGSGELLFQMMSIDLLLLLGEDDNSHEGEESFLLLLCDGSNGLSHGGSIVFFPVSGSGALLLHGREVGGDVCHDQEDGGGGRRRTLGLAQR
jgi:hypothetical protein